MPSVQAKARRERLTALAGRRSIFASRVYPRYRAALQAALDAQVRELAARAREERRPLLPDSLQRRWAKELENAQRGFIPALAAHGWNLAGDEVIAAGKAKSMRGDAMGAKAVEVPGYDDFIQRADWPNLEKWIKTTAESASATTAQRMLRVYEDAAAHYDQDKGRGRTPPEIARQLLSEGLVQSESRANMLAHTGSIWAYNEGATQRYADEGIAVVEWLTAEDELRCPFCASMNGVRIAVKDAFLEAGDTISLGDAGVLKIPKGKFGFDVRHPPLHPNCRCTLIPIVDAGQIEVEVRDDQSAPATATGDTLAFLAGSEEHERKQEEWENGLAKEERAAFQYWARQHDLIQDIDEGIYVADPDAQRAYLDLTAALRRAPRVEGVFQRGIGLTPDALKEIVDSGAVNLPYMQSFTKSRSIARHAARERVERVAGEVPVILVASTSRAIDIKVLTEIREHEFVLPKGSPLKVRSEWAPPRSKAS
ncbi:MAG: hypothetical protein AMXMBFR7_33070 [Planctomycetota bacterium]